MAHENLLVFRLSCVRRDVVGEAGGEDVGEAGEVPSDISTYPSTYIYYVFTISTILTISIILPVILSRHHHCQYIQIHVYIQVYIWIIIVYKLYL